MPKKKYSINWENGEAVSYEVDGNVYASLDEIPDPADMQKLTAMVDGAEDDEFFNEPPPAMPGMETTRSGMPVENIILMIFTGIAALMLVIAGISSASAISKMMKERSAPGRVVDVVVKRQYINEEDRIIEEYYFPVVSFTADDGKRRSVQMTAGSNYQEYENGDEVTVLYDPAHPLEARIKSIGGTMLMWILPGITGILGLAFLGAVLVVRQLMPSPEPTQAGPQVKII